MDSNDSSQEDMMSRLFLPPVQRGMRVLDRSFFRKTIPTSGVLVYTPSKMADIKKACGSHMIPFRGVIPVKVEHTPDGKVQYTHITKEMKAAMGPDAENTHGLKKLIPLHPTIKHDDPATTPAALQRFIDTKAAGLVPYELRMEYEDWDYYQIITSILPEELLDEVPSGFTLSGHIAHINLREAYLPFKQIIGQVILDKNVHCKTVVNKTEEVGVSSEFRTFDMEILAGEPNTEVEVSESNCKFRFDFAKVYWNSRLSTEHNRIIDTFKPGEAVADVMAGVGPFAIPAGKKKVFVWANDLNPESYKAMVENIKLNKATDFVHAHNEDGKDFIRKCVKDLYRLSRHDTWGKVLVQPRIRLSRSNPKPVDEIPLPTVYHVPPTFSHFVMNLPASAVEFLDAFIGVYKGMEQLFEPHTQTKLPLIHLHIFDKPEYLVAYESISQRISKYLNYDLAPEDIEFRDVRLVAPKKRMYCATFRVPPEVAFASAEARRGIEDDPNLQISGLDAKVWSS